MAKVTRGTPTPPPLPPVLVELTYSEARALRDLLYAGVSCESLDKENLGLRDLLDGLQDQNLGLRQHRFETTAHVRDSQSPFTLERR